MRPTDEVRDDVDGFLEMHDEIRRLRASCAELRAVVATQARRLADIDAEEARRLRHEASLQRLRRCMFVWPGVPLHAADWGGVV